VIGTLSCLIVVEWFTCLTDANAWEVWVLAWFVEAELTEWAVSGIGFEAFAGDERGLSYCVLGSSWTRCCEYEDAQADEHKGGEGDLHPGNDGMNSRLRLKMLMFESGGANW
jgi:hypothetical protein